MSYIGSFELDDTVLLVVNTHDPTTGSAANASGNPSFRIYHYNENIELLTSGTLTQIDASNTTGFYGTTFSTSSESFIDGGKYVIRIQATVGGVTSVTIKYFQVRARVGLGLGAITNGAFASNAISDSKIASGAITSAKFASGAITSSVLAANAITSTTIANNAITSAKLATDCITSDELATSAINEIRNAITGGSYNLNTDSNGRIRVVSGTGAGEIALSSGAVNVANNNDKFGYRLSSDLDVYHADLQLTIDDVNGRDEYTIIWYRNGQLLTEELSSPKLTVVNRSDGSNLITNVSMSQIGSEYAYKYDESSNRIQRGEAYLAVVSFTYNSEDTKTFLKVITRDA